MCSIKLSQVIHLVVCWRFCFSKIFRFWSAHKKEMRTRFQLDLLDILHTYIFHFWECVPASPNQNYSPHVLITFFGIALTIALLKWRRNQYIMHRGIFPAGYIGLYCGAERLWGRTHGRRVGAFLEGNKN